MTDKFSTQDIEKSKQYWKDLINEVKKAERLMNDEPGSGPIESSLKSIETSVKFGDLNYEFKKLTKKLCKQLELQLSPIQEDDMLKQFDFYYLVLPLSMWDEESLQFKELTCTCRFQLEDGKTQPVVISIFPANKFKDILNMHSEVNVMLAGNFELEASVPNLPASGIIKAETQNSLKTGFSISLRSRLIKAKGPALHECRWEIEKPELQGTMIPFIIVFKVPKGATAVTFDAATCVTPDFRGLRRIVDKVSDAFSAPIKRLMLLSNAERQGGEHLPLTDTIGPKLLELPE